MTDGLVGGVVGDLVRGLAGLPGLVGEKTLFVDPGRCIGCQACVAACRECDSHKGKAMIHLDYVDAGRSTASMPTVCMHCADPVAPCAQVCPVDAIEVDVLGIVHSAAEERCIACGNCVHACPFGVPKLDALEMLQYKCDLCYDRTSVGLGPMCATVCPTEALFFGTEDELRAARPHARASNVFGFGNTTVHTGCAVVVPAGEHACTVPGGYEGGYEQGREGSLG